MILLVHSLWLPKYDVYVRSAQAWVVLTDILCGSVMRRRSPFGHKWVTNDKNGRRYYIPVVLVNDLRVLNNLLTYRWILLMPL
jgi:hypothetical protein